MSQNLDDQDSGRQFQEGFCTVQSEKDVYVPCQLLSIILNYSMGTGQDGSEPLCLEPLREAAGGRILAAADEYGRYAVRYGTASAQIDGPGPRRHLTSGESF